MGKWRRTGAFLLCNYLLLGGVGLHLPHALASPRPILVRPTPRLPQRAHCLLAAAGCLGSFTNPIAGAGAQHTVHTAGAVLTAIFQGAAAVLAFTRTDDFLTELRSYVWEVDGTVILRLVGGLGAAIFVLEWASLALGFALRLNEDCGEEETDGNEYAKSWPSGYHV